MNDKTRAEWVTSTSWEDENKTALDEEIKKVKEETRVKIVGVDIPFGDMVIFLVKFTLASIPALIILMLIGLVFFVGYLAFK